MVYTPVVYDWRDNCAPISQVFRPGGQSIPGGMTLGGFSTESPEPGGRYEIMMGFAPFATQEANLDASWTIGRILNGSIMRVRMFDTVQLVPDADLGVGGFENGVPWGAGQPWANDENWALNPFAHVAAAAAKGSTQVSVDMADLGKVLMIGHVVGFALDGYDFAHMVMDISYDEDDVAALTISPPLRRPVTTDDDLLFRPTVTVTCINSREVMGQFQSGRHMQFNSATFVEALV